MLDFLIVSTRSAKHDVIEIYPKFKISPTPKDLMASDALSPLSQT